MPADYKIMNMKELEDMAVKIGLAPDLEARFARPQPTPSSGGFSYQKLAPDFRQPFGHRHEDQEEAYVVVGGSGNILGHDTHAVKPWDVVRACRPVARGFAAGRTVSSSSPSAPARAATPRCSRASGRTARSRSRVCRAPDRSRWPRSSARSTVVDMDARQLEEVSLFSGLSKKERESSPSGRTRSRSLRATPSLPRAGSRMSSS